MSGVGKKVPDEAMLTEFPVVEREALGGGSLSRALQAGSTPDNWIVQIAGVDNWRRQFESVRTSFGSSDWLAALSPAFAATGAAAQRLARARQDGVVVTTGQQPGLFGGPAYTWSKAIAALALADELEAQLGVPVAPVFWAASDDADWREAAVTHVVGSNGLETLILSGSPTDGIAMSEVVLGDVEPMLERLRQASGSAANGDVLSLVEAAYVPHATIGASYVQLLRGVLEPLGIAVLDASHPALRAAADPLLRRALQLAPAIDAALTEREAAIRANAFQPQVEGVKGLTQVFRTTRTERGNTRERVPISNAARVVREAEAGTLGANVLLRPVVERALLPTMAYLAGPGELAYFAQVGPIAMALGVSPPVVVPRWSGVVVEPHVTRLLQRLGVGAKDFDDPHAVETQLARATLHESVSDALERARLATETQLRALKSAVVAADDLVVETVIDGASRDIAHRLNRLERRLVAAAKRRETALARDIAIARASLKPLGKSPERVLNLVPALARFGPALLEAMRASARVHAALIVSGDATGTK